MNEQRKKIILNEINYWKDRNLLPSHYCDFLINLYSSGEDAEPEKSKSILQKRRITLNSVNIFVLLFTAILFIVFYFTELSIILQTALILGVSFLLLFIASRKSVFPFLQVLSRIIVAFAILLLSIEYCAVYFPTSPVVILWVIGLQCVLWSIYGYIRNYQYFTYSGIIGLLVLTGFIFLT
ncbi:hypothetical protein [Jeotgalibacillus sp. R-1-5s-1]|uniref:hypothetical protein n=1 Tax=Jeotgalibacillus sp. R-1-5s-1 TaxID=2555897 RepID=UPI001069378E|nr:hypothetical protein [Jeotgalibacillus sp. R-1-5s-1]TFD92317.1 hypothetical protein E2491_16125 [Jeotgalibacillus sp. R-1-5s-1]